MTKRLARVFDALVPRAFRGRRRSSIDWDIPNPAAEWRPIAPALALAGATLLAACSGSAKVSVGGSSSSSPSGLSSDLGAATSSAIPPSTVNALASALPVGDYWDGPEGTPHYVLTVDQVSSVIFSGWIYFVYQDGRIAPVLHYSATTGATGSVVLRSDASPSRFPLGPGVVQANEGQPGSSPVPAGLSYPGTYRTNTVILSYCSAFLYWAAPHPGAGPAQSCTFTYTPSG